MRGAILTLRPEEVTGLTGLGAGHAGTAAHPGAGGAWLVVMRPAHEEGRLAGTLWHPVWYSGDSWLLWRGFPGLP